MGCRSLAVWLSAELCYYWAVCRHSLHLRGLWANLEEAAVHMAVELKNAAFDLMAAESPLYRFSAMQLMSANTCGPKTFNNCLSFERGFWQSKIVRFSVVPKRNVF